MEIELTELASRVGDELGTSDWMTVTQEMIEHFAEATHDHQWIHVDEEAAKDGPFGTTIAHGYLTLSLVPVLRRRIYELKGVGMGLNYGCNKVRFPAPVPSGARVRATSQLLSVDERDKGAVQMTEQMTIEIEDSDRPACVAETVTLLFPNGE